MKIKSSAWLAALLAAVVSLCGCASAAKPKAPIKPEGIIDVDKVLTVPTHVSEGLSSVRLLVFRLTAYTSDARFDSIRIDLGTDPRIYTKALKTLYVLDKEGKRVVQADLNTDTVLKEGNNYFLLLGGFDIKVAHMETHRFTIAADTHAAIMPSDYGPLAIRLRIDSVRAVDESGKERFGPGRDIVQDISVGAKVK